MGRRPLGAIVTLASSVVLAACSGDFDADGLAVDAELGTTSQAVAACAGDDVLYDYNAFAASLAVAVANELGRWDANADFDVKNGKLELSTTGTMRCNASSKGCANVTAMLRLQDDASAAVPNHSPSIYRSKLVQWYQKQTTKLTEVVNRHLTVDKGVYKIKVKHSGKYMAVDNGSTSDGAVVEQRGTVSLTGTDEWRLLLENTKHKLKNVRSGKCLTLSSDTQSDNVTLVQKTCSSSLTTQQFDFAQTGEGFYAIRTKWSSALDVANASTADDARIVQFGWSGPKLNQQWQFVPVGTGEHIDPTVVATAVYYLTARHSGKAVAVDNGSMADGAVIEQGTYSSSDDRFQWYITRSGNDYQFINRRSGKCLGLVTNTTTGQLVQQTCSAAPTQLFKLAPTGDGYTVVYTSASRALEVSGKSTLNDARIVQGDGAWENHRQFKLTPIIASEPHRLTFSHITDDANCGEYNYWYDIAQPNGESLEAPEDSFVQLIFAGGKETLTGNDVNPFIAQQVSGDLVAIDPTYGLNESENTTSGACSATCVKVSKSDVTDACCSCSGTKKFKKSSWNSNTFVCQ